MPRARWFLCAALVAGCAAHAGHHNEVTAAADDTSPATAPTGEMMPLAWTPLKLDDQKPLVKLEAGGETAEFAFKLKPARSDDALYFGELQNADDQLMPVIATRVHGAYKAIKVAKEFGSDQWAAVVSGPKASDVWGVLDQTAGDADNDDRQTDEITIVHSSDSGKTFQVATVRKPCRKASFTEFVMGRNGHGRFTLALTEDCGKQKPGLFHYRTTDGGKTFTRPQYEPDATKPADDVPDAEQPDQGNQSASIGGGRICDLQFAICD